MSNAAGKLLSQAAQARRDHRHDDAKRDLLEAVELCRADGTPHELARSLTALGQIERDLDHTGIALQHYLEAASIYRAEGDALRLAHTVRHAGDILRDQERMEEAEPHYREALAIYRGNEQTSPLDLANAIRGMALQEQAAGNVHAARLLWEEARDLYASVDVDAGVAESSRRLAQL